MSYNRWTYTNGNPVNYSDPSGMWRWKMLQYDEGDVPPTMLAHFLIENYYESTFLGVGNPFRQIEFPIPGTTYNRPDMFDIISGAIFEIEPEGLENSPNHGRSQALRYVDALIRARRNDQLNGYYLNIIYYNWWFTPFRLGQNNNWPGRYKRELFKYVDLIADFDGPGVITYKYVLNENFYALSLTAMIGVITMLQSSKYGSIFKDLFKNPFGNRQLQPDFVNICNQIILIAGLGILVGTVIEDVLTGGAGIADDPLTISLSLYLIGLSQEVALPIVNYAY